MVETKEELYSHVMGGNWDKVVEIYEKHSESKVRHMKLTYSSDTALHMAVYEEKTDVVKKLVSLIAKDIKVNGGCQPSWDKQIKKKEEYVAKITQDLTNDEGNNPLHVAAKMGKWKICYHIANQVPCLVDCRNKATETPFFLAALHGKQRAFLILYVTLATTLEFTKDKLYEEGRRNSDGRTILHCAIDGEKFDLAYQIIQRFPNFVDSFDHRGYTPFHVLATKHSAFRSSCSLTWGQRFVYSCTPAEKPTVHDDKHYEAVMKQLQDDASRHSKEEETPIQITEASDTGLGNQMTTDRKSVPPTDTHILIKRIWRSIVSLLQNDASQHSKATATPEDERPIEIKTEASSSKSFNIEDQMTTDRESVSPTDTHILIKDVWRSIVKDVWRSIVSLLQNGYLRMQCLFPKHMVKMRKTHLWANTINHVILQNISYYKGHFQSGNEPESESESMFWGQKLPDETPPDDQDNQTERKGAPESPICSISTLSFPLNELGNDVARLLTTVTESLVSLKSSPPNDIKKETPILVAAKNGIEEITKSILQKFHVAMHDVNSDGKNLMILAVENRQPQIYQLLVKMAKKKIISKKVLKDLFLGVDKEGNSALHLAAMLKTYQPWRAPDAILQMQWEIKWYECIKEQMPTHLLGHQNKDGKTAEEIFMETHSELVKNDIEWLMKTSDSCTIVAALIATVAFATSVSVPGGTKGHGEPVLGREPMFEIFSFSSLGTLCFSLTAVVMFLAILTSRHQATDFGCILPTKLLIGLTALFLSIASVLVSFCGGHFFVVRDILKDAKAVEYVVAVIPVLVFAIAQFPLYFKLIWATMNKVPQRGFMLTSGGSGTGGQTSSNLRITSTVTKKESPAQQPSPSSTQ